MEEHQRTDATLLGRAMVHLALTHNAMEAMSFAAQGLDLPLGYEVLWNEGAHRRKGRLPAAPGAPWHSGPHRPGSLTERHRPTHAGVEL